MSGIAQLEDYDEQLYKVVGKTDDPEGATEKYLIATSEQPMCGYHQGDWLEESELPKKCASRARAAREGAERIRARILTSEPRRARKVRRRVVVLPQGGGLVGQGHSRHLPRSPV